MTIAFFILQGIVFAAWAFFMFRNLFRLWGDIAARTGSYFSLDMPLILDVYATFFTAGKYRFDRRALLLLTILVIALAMSSALIVPRLA